MIRGWRLLGRSVAAALALLPAYAAFAYVVVPAAWSRHQRNARAADVPGLTYTAERLPADPLNVAFAGTRAIRGAFGNGLEPIQGADDAVIKYVRATFASPTVTECFRGSNSTCPKTGGAGIVIDHFKEFVIRIATCDCIGWAASSWCLQHP